LPPHPSNNLDLPMKTAAEIMDADVPTVTREEDARRAIELMAQTDKGAIAVVDTDGKVVGIVSESDLILSDEESDLHLPHYVNIMGGVIFIGSMKGFEERLNKAFATNVRDLMSSDPVVVSVGDDAELVAKTIADKHHNHLPVVDDEGRFAGMVTRADALAALVAE
jgi:CBS domain-containing protein